MGRYTDYLSTLVEGWVFKDVSNTIKTKSHADKLFDLLNTGEFTRRKECLMLKPNILTPTNDALASVLMGAMQGNNTTVDGVDAIHCDMVVLLKDDDFFYYHVTTTSKDELKAKLLDFLS